MKYFYDTEFLEGSQKDSFGKLNKPTIDLISIGILSEDDREYYAISGDFNLYEAWNRNDGTITEPFYWIRLNVLKPVYDDLCKIQENSYHKQYDQFADDFTLSNMEWMLQQHGKSNYVIAREILEFINPSKENKAELYGYYSAYDHVVFCWLFGLMKNLPKGLPMYTIDLKQELNSIAMSDSVNEGISLEESIDLLKQSDDYPKQENEHNALDDARWNKKLYEFLKSI